MHFSFFLCNTKLNLRRFLLHRTKSETDVSPPNPAIQFHKSTCTSKCYENPTEFATNKREKKKSQQNNNNHKFYSNRTFFPSINCFLCKCKILLIVLSQGFLEPFVSLSVCVLLFLFVKMCVCVFFRTSIHIHLQLFHITMAVHINSLIFGCCFFFCKVEMCNFLSSFCECAIKWGRILIRMRNWISILVN